MTPRGACPVCGMDVSLRKGDLVRKHLDNREPYRAGRPNWCAGSGKPNDCTCSVCVARRVKP